MLVLSRSSPQNDTLRVINCYSSLQFVPSSMNLLLFNLATDADDTVLGFTTDWLSTFSQYFTNIYVITMRSGKFQLPSNVSVYSIGKERGCSRPRRMLEFYRCLRRILKSHDVDVCFAHMIPIFAV